MIPQQISGLGLALTQFLDSFQACLANALGLSHGDFLALLDAERFLPQSWSRPASSLNWLCAAGLNTASVAVPEALPCNGSRSSAATTVHPTTLPSSHACAVMAKERMRWSVRKLREDMFAGV